jgi:hypothetical protein
MQGGLRFGRKWPGLAGLPIGYSGAITIGHFDLRQALLVEHVVFADNAVLRKNKGGKCVYLVGLQRAFLFERRRKAQGWREDFGA